MTTDFDLSRAECSWGGVKLRGADDSLVIQPATLPPGPQIVLTLKADAPVVDELLKSSSVHVPLDITEPHRRPLQRRHARGGLKPMVAKRVHHFTSRGFTVQGGNDKPWTCTFQVTKRRRDQ